jgi:hypothetical protein
MATTKYSQNNLNAGELSPLLEGRADIDRYFNAVGTMKNWIPMVQGGATRRPGFHLADYAKYNDKQCRLIPFEFGTTQAYVVEVGHQYMRFFMDGYLIRQVTGGDLITNGAFTTDLAGWVNYSVSPGTAIWESAQAKLDGGADGEGSIGQAITTVSGKTYLLTFDVTNNPLHVRIGTSTQGSQIIYDVQYAVGSKQLTFIARGTTTYIQFLRKENGASYLDNVICKEYAPVELLTSPYTESDLTLLKWAQNADNLFIVHPLYQVRVLTRTSSVAWTLTTIEFEDGPYFEQVASSSITPSAATGNITMVATAPLWYSGHVGALWRLGYFDTSSPPVMKWGYVVITSVEDTTHCHATVKTTLPETGATDAHREGRWSTYRGFPCSVTFHENRLIFAGTATSPQTFWGSKMEEWDNHTPGTLDDDPIAFTIGSNKVNIIHWVASARTLIIGTPGGEFRAAGGNDNPITPSNINVKNETTNEVADCMPLRIGNAILYIQRAGQQILEMKYNFDSDAYEADDVTLYSDHLTRPGIMELNYQRGYSPLIWARRSDGNFLSLLYNQKQQAIGWSQHLTNGMIESMAIIPNPIDRSDDVYAAIKRTINGTEKRFIEYLDPYLNVDCGLNLVSSVPVDEISGLEHLIGEIVDIVGDGAVYPQQVVDANGKVYLDPMAYSIEIGKHYDSYLKTLRPETKETKGQSSMSSHKKWSKIFARLYETVGLKINGEVVPFRSSQDPMDYGITPYTGDRHIINTGWEDEGRIVMEQVLPLSATVLCIFGDLEINEN